MAAPAVMPHQEAAVPPQNPSIRPANVLTTLDGTGSKMSLASSPITSSVDGPQRQRVVQPAADLRFQPVAEKQKRHDRNRQHHGDHQQPAPQAFAFGRHVLPFMVASPESALRA